MLRLETVFEGGLGLLSLVLVGIIHSWRGCVLYSTKEFELFTTFTSICIILLSYLFAYAGVMQGLLTPAKKVWLSI